ncbi:unnamed protein product [Rotaria sordida]|uniref:Aminopeptidase n=2 Tax=Rotaria sordida TaxID=392033 RepID=A0A815STQ3_9BILA|nr:unnamed protein product [Rotaria sordida]CAF4163363.1 unnamed protein product [Rotaria sordida]
MILSLNKRVKFLSVCISIGIILVLVTLALAAATLGVVVNRLKDKPIDRPSLDSEYAESIQISDIMMHLNELQNIATNTGGNRAINTIGFNQTLDYINNYLSSHTNFKVATNYFYLRNFILASNPILITSINGTTINRLLSSNLSIAEFYFVQYTRSANFADYVPISVIPNEGCSDNDWLAANPSPNGRVALVKRGDCNFLDKAVLASKYNVAALLFYNDGTSPGRISPIFVSLGQNNELPALFLSYTLGQELADAARNPLNNVGVRITISLTDESRYPVGNICADTPTGDATQTIVIGGHSDSVPAGPGINDNGSGSAANLGLAVALARLFETSTYEKYKYRVRFCWWGAEEVGLLGSDFHVQQAGISTVVGERLIDYLINLNYDMLGSPNYMFGIYDARTANNNTPVHALPGSSKITNLYREWFIRQNLPWNNTDFSGRSDYGPFLAKGIVAGGLFSGADDMKSLDERNYYDKMLGQGLGGIAGAIHDPCYHRACDSIQNINVFAFEKMVQAAAYVLEYLARQDDLQKWLYPEGRSLGVKNQQSQRKYNSINEYFGLPYS